MKHLAEGEEVLVAAQVAIVEGCRSLRCSASYVDKATTTESTMWRRGAGMKRIAGNALDEGPTQLVLARSWQAGPRQPPQGTLDHLELCDGCIWP